MIKRLFFDLETKSDIDLGAVGLMRYAHHPSTFISLFAYAKNTQPIETSPFSTNALATATIKFIDEADEIWAHNIRFDREVIKAQTGYVIPIEKCYDTMWLTAYNGLGLALEKAAQMLGIEGKVKLSPDVFKRCTSASEIPSFNEWGAFIDYAKQDVELVRTLSKLPPLPQDELQLARETLLMNERGMRIDKRLALLAEEGYERLLRGANQRIERLTDGQIKKVSQNVAIAKYLGTTDVQAPTLKEYFDTAHDPIRKEVALIRAQAGMVAPKKYKKIIDTEYNGRVHDAFAYHGASNARWVGRGVQLQNLARPTVPEKDAVMKIRAGFPSMNDLVTAVRPTFMADEGYMLIQADLAQIEARVLACKARDHDLLQLFRDNKDLYKQTASRMYGVQYNDVNDALRFRGKVCALALGYQSGRHGLRKFARNYGADWTEETCEHLVEVWRANNPAIVDLWYQMERDVEQAYLNPNTRVGDVMYNDAIPALYIFRPSGKHITYVGFHIEDDGTFRYRHPDYGVTDTYGGSLIQTLVSAIARDVMGEIWLRNAAVGLHPLMTVHDELVYQVKEENVPRAERVITTNFTQPIEWAQDLPLACSLDVRTRYGK